MLQKKVPVVHNITIQGGKRSVGEHTSCVVECSQTVEPMACRRQGNWTRISVQLFLLRSAAWFAPALELAINLGGKEPARLVRVTTVQTSLLYDDVVVG